MSKTTDIATIAVLGALGVGGYLIFKNKDEIGKFFGGIGDGIGNFTDSVGKLYGDTVTGIQKGAEDVAKTVGDVGGGIAQGATNVLSGVGSGAEKTVTGIGNTLAGVGVGLEKTVTGVADGATKFFSGVAMGLQNTVTGIGDFFGDLFNNRVTEDAPTTKAPTETKTPIMQGKPSSQDLSKYKVKNKALYDKTYGEGNYEVIGAPLNMTKEEKASRPVLSFNQLAEKDNFIGRVAKYVLKKS